MTKLRSASSALRPEFWNTIYLLLTAASRYPLYLRISHSLKALCLDGPILLKRKPADSWMEYHRIQRVTQKEMGVAVLQNLTHAHS